TPCTTLREQTEWVETLENDWNVLSSIDVEEVKTKVQRELICLQHPQPNFFGDGKAAKKICEAIINGGNKNESN
ncbi:MAG TPA: UDP-N-acetylglucosamine 2-epimerase, partial [Tissierellaceae bacterium]|nr:UDP-N-acetylglucosamine 2-epimerase [Tissierellaceae bacterium]